MPKRRKKKGSTKLKKTGTARNTLLETPAKQNIPNSADQRMRKLMQNETTTDVRI